MLPLTDLPHRIRNYRRSLGENQTIFANRFGVKRLTVGKWEKGILPNGKHLTRLIAEMDSAEVKTENETSFQFELPFEQPFELIVKISPQASRTIHFEVWKKTKAS